MATVRTTQPYGTWTELRVMRTKDGMDLTTLASLSGLSLSYLSDLERGRRLPNAKVLKQVAKALNCPVSVIQRTKYQDDAGRDLELRELIREIVREEIARGAA
ncbi:helix-turn-helix domain-containing protein [Mycobacteroides abscessus]|uniref:helix-turn-helix domain-containing protein n=1 Tax=Mycobacteroides abscessus TaxID=36809 RepID=UPI000D9E2333|nr:helix-turn-helix domain-containing protein [Mycobacteroides abscessus]SPX87634.1 transcriptional regulator [Mycobacteroides abscessus]